MPFILALKVLKMISMGNEVFLASVVTSSCKFPHVHELHVVKDYSNVFLNGFPGLPPHREVDF